MKKRILSIFLTIALLLTALIPTAFAVGNSNNYKMTCRVSSEGTEGNYKDKTSSNYGLSEDTLQAFLGVLASGNLLAPLARKLLSRPVRLLSLFKKLIPMIRLIKR